MGSNHGQTLRYISTRGLAPALTFSDAMLAGLARDGGLYVPESFPALSHSDLAGQSVAAVTEAVIAPFVGADIAPAALKQMVEASAATFRHAAVTPLVQIDDNLFVLELFHGPTLAFKDVAMQLLGRLMDHELKRRGQRATIVGATSGDTGAAAIEAFAGLEQIDLFILYPHGRVSEVQRRQMTTNTSPNVHAIALEGTFDDCQTIVKGLFGHHEFADQVALSGVNSINWARVMTQVSYFVTASLALGGPNRKVSFAVPTGNFGDVLAGFYAQRMGLAVERLVVATNANDILVRALATGTYDLQAVTATQSPSMDIQISSNFERLLFEAQGREPASVRALMESLKHTGRFTLDPAPLAAIRAKFDAGRTDEAQTSAEMARTYKDAGYILDPHTAVAVSVARRFQPQHRATPMVVLGTAHPAKFPDAVQKAIGLRPNLPPHLADLWERMENFTVLANQQAVIEKFVRAKSRQTKVHG